VHLDLSLKRMDLLMLNFYRYPLCACVPKHNISSPFKTHSIPLLHIPHLYLCNSDPCWAHTPHFQLCRPKLCALACILFPHPPPSQEPCTLHLLCALQLSPLGFMQPVLKSSPPSSIFCLPPTCAFQLHPLQP
jgi:hypothetical protein